MSKLTKMQLNRVEESLMAIAEIKQTEFENSLITIERPSIEDAIAEAKGNPQKFIELAEKRYRNHDRYDEFKEAVKQMPKYLKASKKAHELSIDCDKQIANNKEILKQEQQRIMDDLYLADSPDALKSINSFKEFKKG